MNDLSVISVERQDWFISLIDECKNLITETEFTARWTLIEGYHNLGVLILKENSNFERAKIYGQEITQCIAESLGKSERTINYAIRFAKEYPDLNLLPEAKNTSWSHIINKYLTDGTEKKVVKKADLIRMIKEIKELLNVEYLEYHQEVIELGTEYGGPQIICNFVRYLQDQFNKIVEELGL